MNNNTMSKHFQQNQRVWVKSLDTILATLDQDGKLEGMPFMPEMTRFCGQSFRITCLPAMSCVEGAGFRSLTGFVFLENLRCNGQYHDNCQRDCLLFWKEAWLSDQPENASPQSPVGVTTTLSPPDLKTREGERYFCQSTELAGATSEYHPDESLSGKLRKMFIDLRHGDMTFWAFLAKLFQAAINRLKGVLGMDDIGPILGQRLKTESLSLDLQPGEWVEVKTRKEIEDTLDIHGKNRGLVFDFPMAASCGQQFQVERQLHNIILEETGQMITLNNTVLLRDDVCTAWGCPRANRPFWREIWLRRVKP